MPGPVVADVYPGLPTRDQSPLLQGYLLPAMPITTNEGWSYSSALYITNTYQRDKEGNENIIIDVENSRFDLQLSYSHQLWHFNINLSMIDNQEGFLDTTIEDWHDLFGLPQGGRDRAPKNRLEITYQKNGGNIFSITQPGNGLADIQLSAGYQLSDNSQAWLALEIPAGTDDILISNDQPDLAFWFTGQKPLSAKTQGYASAGVALPGNGGIFKNRLEDLILFAQAGSVYQYSDNFQLLFQADYHSPVASGSDLPALDHSLQGQFILRLPRLIDGHRLDLFFSEDIWPGHAPDITFSIQLSTAG